MTNLKGTMENLLCHVCWKKLELRIGQWDTEAWPCGKKSSHEYMRYTETATATTFSVTETEY